MRRGDQRLVTRLAATMSSESTEQVKGLEFCLKTHDRAILRVRSMMEAA
jgi:hypothetical protein